jgi:small subunit ribosomal protein S25e
MLMALSAISRRPDLTLPTRSKGKVKDKAQHAVILDKATSEKLYKDVQSYRLVTVATLVDRLKINGSLARRCLADLEEKGQIKKVVGHSKCSIYSRSPLEVQTGRDHLLISEQLVRLLLRMNKKTRYLVLRCHDRSSFEIDRAVDVVNGMDWDICNGFGTFFGVAYPIELLLQPQHIRSMRMTIRDCENVS